MSAAGYPDAAGGVRAVDASGAVPALGAEPPGDSTPLPAGRIGRTPGDVSPWERVDSEPGPDLLLFRPRYDRMRHPVSGGVLTRLVLESRDWVNVIARTTAGRYVVVRQFRFGSGRVATEIPGGVVDPGEQPAAAAARELREETGYTSTRWTYLGSVEPNPAFLDNRCHHFLAEDAARTHAPAPDEGEDIAVGTLSAEELRDLILRGEIAHSLVLSALCRVMDLRLRP